MQKREFLQGIFIGVIVVLAALSRVIPHPWNFTPVIAILIFSAATFKNSYFKFAIPFLVIVLSDVLLHIKDGSGFHSGTPLVYGSYVAISLFSFALLKKINVGKVLLTSVLSSVIFFLITNFALFYPASPTVNLALGAYPHTLEGVIASYTSAIPFFRNALTGDLIFTGILFGAYTLSTLILSKTQRVTSI